MSYKCTCCGLTAVEAAAVYWQKKRDALKARNTQMMMEALE